MLAQLTDDDRQKKQRKSRMYKQMLDQQVLFNQKYREQQSRPSEHNGRIPLNGFNQQRVKQQPIYPIVLSHLSHENEFVDQSRVSSMEDSIIKDEVRSRFYSKNTQLPVIKDKNIHIRGQSRFILVDKPNKMKRKPSVYLPQTESIMPNQSFYNSTCEKIIEELKQINQASSSKRKERKHFMQIQPIKLAKEKKIFQNHIDNQKDEPKKEISQKDFRNTRYKTEQPEFHYKTNHKKMNSEHLLEVEPKKAELKQQASKILNQFQTSASSQLPSYSPSSFIKPKQNIKTEIPEVSKVISAGRMNQNFITILRQVKNRGHGLFEKLKHINKKNGLNSNIN